MEHGLRPLAFAVVGSALAIVGAWSSCAAAEQLFITPGLDYSNADAQILKFDSRTGAYSGVLAPSQGLDSSVYGLTVGPDGYLYGSYFDWSDMDGRILRISLAGEVETFVAAGTTTGDWPTGLVFGPDGNLYVANLRPGNILRYDGQTGAFIDVFASGLSSCQDMVFGPDGNLYVSGGSTDSISRIDGVTGAFLGYVVAPGSLGSLRSIGIAFGPSEDLYVASFPAESVYRLDGISGAVISRFDVPLLPSQQTVKDVAFGPDGNLYVGVVELGSPSHGAVLRLDPDSGTMIDQFATLPDARRFETGMLFVDPACSSLGSVAGSASGCFTRPAVSTVEQQLAALSTAVTGVGPGKSLINKVGLAQTYYAVPDIQATCAVLTDFVGQVTKWSTSKKPKIGTDEAGSLIADARAIMDAMGCD